MRALLQNDKRAQSFFKKIPSDDVLTIKITSLMQTKNANLVSLECEKTTGIPRYPDFLALLETAVSAGNLRPFPGLTLRKEFHNFFVHLSFSE